MAVAEGLIVRIDRLDCGQLLQDIPMFRPCKLIAITGSPAAKASIYTTPNVSPALGRTKQS